MEAQEKANELIDKFREYAKDLRVSGYMNLYNRDEETENAKQCAVICVQEIIENNFWEDGKSQENYRIYWQQVLEYLKSEK